MLAWLILLPVRAAVALDPSLARMPVFEEPLTWVGEDLPGDEESEALWASIDLMREHGPRLGMEALEAFVEATPQRRGTLWNKVWPKDPGNMGRYFE